MDKKYKNSIVFLLILSFVLITSGTTLAFFDYTKQGTTENVIKTGLLTFHYTEIDQIGAGVEIIDSYPISDSKGKTLSGDRDVFNFSVESNTTNKTNIPYIITVKKDGISDLDENVVRVYLTEVNGGNETSLKLETYKNLPLKDGLKEGEVERVIYKDTVPINTKNYYKQFKFRMWIDENTDFSGVEQADGTMVYPYNDKKFKVKINVYANGDITDNEIKNSIKIFNKDYLVNKDEPTLNNSSNNTSDVSGIYASTKTNSGNPTYYFRGNVDNNYVDFAGHIWRIVRVNEDGTLKLIMQDGILDNSTFIYASTNYENTQFFANSDVKKVLNTWYNDNLKKYSSYIETGNYCQDSINFTDSKSDTDRIHYEDYTPDFKCNSTINEKIGLITYNEVIYAGGYYNSENTTYYLHNGHNFWTMTSPNRYNGIFIVSAFGGNLSTSTYNYISTGPDYANTLRPVINVKNAENVLGEGTIDEPFVIGNVESNTSESISIFGETYDVQTKNITYTKSIADSSDVHGLYKSTDTNSGNPTYYFRGNVENNYVRFANLDWRIVRVNEDGTIRLISTNLINEGRYSKYSNSDNYLDAYYTNSIIKDVVNNWYNEKLSDYSSYIATGDYYCEAARVKYTPDSTLGNSNLTTYASYKPTFKCNKDGNGYGIVNSNIGFLSYDEVVFAGGYPYSYNYNTQFYLYNGYNYYYTMSPATYFSSSNGNVWYLNPTSLYPNTANTSSGMRAVINLNNNISPSSGKGLVDDPFIIN